jgi:hypothetical protein
MTTFILHSSLYFFLWGKREGGSLAYYWSIHPDPPQAVGNGLIKGKGKTHHPPSCETEKYSWRKWMGSRDESVFLLKRLKIRSVRPIYTYALMVFNFFGAFLKIKSRFFCLFLWTGITYKFWKILSVTLFKDPTVAVLTIKMHTESRLWSKKIINESQLGQDKSWQIFTAPWEGWKHTGEHRPCNHTAGYF